MAAWQSEHTLGYGRGVAVLVLPFHMVAAEAAALEDDEVLDLRPAKDLL